MELSHAQHTLAAEGTRLPTETLRGKELPQEKPAQLATSGEKLPKAALPEERLGAITLQGEGLPDACYSYDGSLEGMLSAIFASLTTPDHVTDIVEEGHIQPKKRKGLGHRPDAHRHVKGSFATAWRVQRRWEWAPPIVPTAAEYGLLPRCP